MNHLDRGFELKEVSKSGIFVGYGSVYGVMDHADDIVMPGAFAKSLGKWAQKDALPALLWQHRTAEPIGRYTKMVEEESGLYIEGELALKTQRGAEAYELLKMKALSGLSIGFETVESEYNTKTGVRLLKECDLWEISLVTFPCNDVARVSTVKNVEQITDLKSIERLLRDSGGFSRSEAVAIVARVKSLAQSESASVAETEQLIAALQRRSALIRC